MKEEFSVGVWITEKEVSGYGICSKCLVYSIESQVVAKFREQTSVVESFSR